MGVGVGALPVGPRVKDLGTLPHTQRERGKKRATLKSRLWGSAYAIHTS